MIKPKRPKDPMQLAKYIADIATGAIKDGEPAQKQKVKKATKKRAKK